RRMRFTLAQTRTARASARAVRCTAARESVPMRLRLRAMARRRRPVFATEAATRAMTLPEELRRRPLQPTDLGHRRGIEQPAIDHHHRRLRRIANLLQRIAVDDHQIGALAGLDRTELLAKA